MKAGPIEFRHHNKLMEYPAAAAVVDVTAAGANTCPLTHPIVRVNSAAGAVTAYNVANGEEGQFLKIISENAENIDIVPATSIEFSAIALDDVGDSASLMYVDDTVGWIILGLVGAANAVLFTAA